MSNQVHETENLQLEAHSTGLSVGDTRRSPERAVTRARKVETLRARYAARAEELAEHAHPLDPLSPEEYESVAHAVRHDERFRYHMRFASASLVEPTKRELASGADIERMAEVLLLDGRRRVTYIVLVDVRQRAVTAWDEVPGQQQPAITIDEFVDIEIETKSDPRVQDALRRRGLDLQQRALVMVDPWSAGNFDIEAEKGRRIARGTFYMRSQNDDNQYAHPIDGMIALIDLDTLELIDVEDEHVYPVPMDDANYGEKFVDEWRDDIKPLEITQPEGPSFTVEGWKVSWQKWSFRWASTSARAWSCTTSATTTKVTTDLSCSEPRLPR